MWWGNVPFSDTAEQRAEGDRSRLLLVKGGNNSCNTRGDSLVPPPSHPQSLTLVPLVSVVQVYFVQSRSVLI